jgi:hypothetical protein
VSSRACMGIVPRMDPWSHAQHVGHSLYWLTYFVLIGSESKRENLYYTTAISEMLGVVTWSQLISRTEVETSLKYSRQSVMQYCMSGFWPRNNASHITRVIGHVSQYHATAVGQGVSQWTYPPFQLFALIFRISLEPTAVACSKRTFAYLISEAEYTLKLNLTH